MTRTDESPTAADPPPQRRPSEPLMLALIGLGIALLLFGASALPVLLNGDDDGDVDSLAVRPAVTVEPSADPDTSATSDSSDPSDSGDSGDSDGSVVATSDATAPPADQATASTGADATTGDESTGDETTGDETTGDQSTGEATTTTTTTTTTTSGSASVAEVPESRATVLEGKIYLEGAVPDEASRDQIVALASEVLGPDNVIDGYTIDPRASDPNLGQVLVADAVLFESDSAVIASEFLPLLNQGLALLTIRPDARFVIIGHTDSRGTDAYNDYLSQERALSLVRWYEARGIDRSRLSAIGRGSREPIATNDTPEGRQQNRRIEVVIENLLSDAG